MRIVPLDLIAKHGDSKGLEVIGNVHENPDLLK
jgi:hypothetical protein